MRHTPWVLVVDDNLSTVRLLGDAFEIVGVQSVLCTNLVSARMALRERGRPDLVLVDVHIPHTSHVELRRFLAHCCEGVGSPVYLVSAMDAEALKDLADTTGVDGYLCKPFPMGRVAYLAHQEHLVA